MKTLILTFVFLFSVSAFANIKDSQLEVRHQELIKKAVEKECFFRKASFVEISNQVTPIHVDQGITDYSYETVLEVTASVDQGVFDLYTVIVKSDYSDMYDHSSQNWGVYSVQSVECVMQ